MTTRYSLFKKITRAKTGEVKPIRKAHTRSEARAHKAGNTAIGIWDSIRGAEVR